MANRGRNLGKLPNGVLDLLVEHSAVSDDDDRIEDVLTIPLQTDELMSQPGDGVALAASGGVLD